MECPFCGDIDFDKVGLKSHITNGDCEIFNQTEAMTRIFQDRQPDNKFGSYRRGE